MRDSKLRELIRMVEEADIEALEIRRPFSTIKITKRRAGNHNGSSPSAAPNLVEAVVPHPAPAPTPATAPVPAAAPAPAPEAKEEAPPSNLVEIKAPMVGTFYRAPAPGAPPFVEVGAKVNPGDTLCIIEAMKLMNEIEAEQPGKIVKILIEDAQPIEFGQVLFLLDPAG
jgi:acetyl-CoA carboxylase biotin carboxyl carrier protein